MLIRHESDIALVIQSIKAMLPTAKHGVVVDIKKKVFGKTTAQKNFYFHCLGKLHKFLRESGVTGEFLGIKLSMSVDSLHELNKKEFGIGSINDLSIKEFCDFMDEMFAFWIDKTNGCWTPPESTRSWLEKAGYNVNW